MYKFLALTSLIGTLLFSCKKFDDTEALNKLAVDPVEVELLTLNTIPEYYSDRNTTFVIADLDGNILTTHKYVQGETKVVLKTSKKFSGTFVNYFQVDEFQPKQENVMVYTNVKLKSYFNWAKPLYKNKEAEPFYIKLKNIPEFKSLQFTTDNFTGIMPSMADTANYNNQLISRRENSKFFMQIEKNDGFYYNFFDIAPDSNDMLSIDVSKCTNKAIMKKVIFPGDAINLGYSLQGKTDLKYDERYNITFNSMDKNSSVIPVPGKSFEYYPISLFYGVPFNLADKGLWSYVNRYSSVPSNVKPLETRFEELDVDQKTFKVKFLGELDYYFAMFGNVKALIANKSPYFCAYYVYSDPKVTSINWPDLATELKMPELDVNDYDLSDLSMTKFNCERSYYLDYLNKRIDGITESKKASFLPIIKYPSLSKHSQLSKNRGNMDIDFGMLNMHPLNNNPQLNDTSYPKNLR